GFLAGALSCFFCSPCLCFVTCCCFCFSLSFLPPLSPMPAPLFQRNLASLRGRSCVIASEPKVSQLLSGRITAGHPGPWHSGFPASFFFVNVTHGGDVLKHIHQKK